MLLALKILNISKISKNVLQFPKQILALKAINTIQKIKNVKNVMTAIPITKTQNIVIQLFALKKNKSII